jgi:Holliday junction DNA helicase RuvA
MIYSLKGPIVAVEKDRIAVDVHDVAYELLVSRPNEWVFGASVSVYCYEVLTQDDHYLVGFSSKLEKQAFLSLIQVKGIGPKTALNALKETTPDDLFKAISANNTAYLKKLPGIGPKAAAQIILDLKGQLLPPTAKATPNNSTRFRKPSRTLASRAKTSITPFRRSMSPISPTKSFCVWPYGN